MSIAPPHPVRQTTNDDGSRHRVRPVLMRALVIVTALIPGAAAGWLCEQVPVRPLAQNIAAALLGWIVGSVGAVGPGSLGKGMQPRAPTGV